MGHSAVLTEDVEFEGKLGSRIVVNQAVPASTQLAPAVEGVSHRVRAALLTLGAAGTLKFQSNVTDLCGPLDLGQQGGFVFDSETPFFVTAAGEALNLVTSGGAAHGVVLITSE